jgi:phosphoglycolate phosphatase
LSSTRPAKHHRVQPVGHSAGQLPNRVFERHKTLLILWDIDHTLIETGGVGSEIYAAAFQKVTGRPMERTADVSGRTEPIIFRETLALHGIEYTADLYSKFADEQARGYAERIADLRQRGRALPGAADALATLARRDGAFQLVLTGNTRPASQTKLSAFGLDAYLNLDAAAFGTDSDERADLVDIARRRSARLTGLAFGPLSTVLIGDTPADVAAARDGDARIIAVASGDFNAEDLATAGATTVPD